MNFPEKGFYYHYKHDPKGEVNNYAYEVVGFSRDTENKSFSVLYVPIYENDWFAPADFQARPLEIFMENITKDGKNMPRFSKITDEKIIEELERIKKEMYL